MSENQPIHKIRLGALEAAIWENQSDKGSFCTVTFSRSYKKDEVWKKTDSFRGDDLLALSKASNLAFDWLHVNGKI